jgi:tetratricopeptide (TPR) repeat protein
MNTTRLDRLLEFLKEDPNDPFTIYAIATEYNNINQKIAQTWYEKLLKEHESYLPTYYHAAKLYLNSGLSDLAESTYKKGIALAQAQKNHHALRELQNAYNNFLYGEDEGE